MTSLLRSNNAWIVRNLILAFAAMVILRYLKGAMPESAGDFGWTLLSAVLLMLLTGGIPITIGILRSSGAGIAPLYRHIATGLLILLSAIMMIQA